MENYGKILIKSVNWIGDAVFMTPLLSVLRKNFPSSRISLLVNPRVKDVFRLNRDVDEIIVYDTCAEHRGLFKKIGFIRSLRKKKFDLGIVVQPHSYEAALLVFFAGIRHRIGYSFPLRDVFLTKTVRLEAEKKHDVEVFQGVLKALGIESAERDVSIGVDERSESWAEDFLRENGMGKNGLLVGLNPGASSQARRWPEERYAALCDRITREGGAGVIIFYGPGDEEVAKRVLSLVRERPAMAETDIMHLAALAKRCNLFIGNDTGPVHIAAAVGTPTIAIVGSTDPGRTRPLGDGHCVINKNILCSPCFRKTCEQLTCMRMITVDEVFFLAMERLKK